MKMMFVESISFSFDCF